MLWPDGRPQSTLCPTTPTVNITYNGSNGTHTSEHKFYFYRAGSAYLLGQFEIFQNYLYGRCYY